MILSADAKKVARGLDDEFGDQDLMGFEQPNLKDMKARLESELNEVDSLSKLIESHQMGSVDVDKVVCHISQYVQSISVHIRELREQQVSHTFHLKKLYSQAGERWRESRLVQAISRMQARNMP